MAHSHNDINAISPARNGAAITPNDSTDLTYVTKSLFIGVGGNVTIDHVYSGTSILYANVPSGTILPVQATRVYATGTTATSIVGMY
jgi:hypothetical protein